MAVFCVWWLGFVWVWLGFVCVVVGGLCVWQWLCLGGCGWALCVAVAVCGRLWVGCVGGCGWAVGKGLVGCGWVSGNNAGG